MGDRGGRAARGRRARDPAAGAAPPEPAGAVRASRPRRTHDRGGAGRARPRRLHQRLRSSAGSRRAAGDPRGQRRRRRCGREAAVGARGRRDRGQPQLRGRGHGAGPRPDPPGPRHRSGDHRDASGPFRRRAERPWRGRDGGQRRAMDSRRGGEDRTRAQQGARRRHRGRGGGEPGPGAGRTHRARLPRRAAAGAGRRPHRDRAAARLPSRDGVRAASHPDRTPPRGAHRARPPPAPPGRGRRRGHGRERRKGARGAGPAPSGVDGGGAQRRAEARRAPVWQNAELCVGRLSRRTATFPATWTLPPSTSSARRT